MLEIIIVFAIGLLVGWNLLPQPAWVKALWDKVVLWFKSLINK